MALPIAAVDAGVGDRIAAVDHLAIANVDTNVRHGIGGSICPLEENQVGGFRVGRRYGGAIIIQSLGGGAAYAPARVIEHPAYKA